VDPARVHFVGNVMIDSLLRHRERARASGAVERFGLRPRTYSVCTLHRPSNVDESAAAANTVAALDEVARRVPVVLPLHPRTRARWEALGFMSSLASKRVQVVDPLGYLDFLALMDHARLVFTDSGGIQEETTALGVPCLTFRENTERPITVTEGTNRVVGVSPARVADAVENLLNGPPPAARVPELWDGRTAHRIVDVLVRRARDDGH
jgi:UDP-N-acetylglucosamine 2-epimerase (non-hydrolysing)